MKTRQQFLDYLADLRSHDASVAVALQQLLAGADEGGRISREQWLSSVRDEYERLAESVDLDLHVHGDDGDGSDSLADYLDDQVLARLEAADIARKEPSESWTTLAVEPDLWTVLEGDLDAFREEVDDTVERLRRQGSRTEIDAGSGLVEGGSQLRGAGLTKIYRRRKVVNDVDIHVRQGETVGLLGPNGAGKTTTFYMIVGLIPPNEGEVYLDGREITDVPMYKRSRMGIGYLAQEPSVFRKLTVEENVLAILETLNLPRDQEKARLEELLQELGLTHLRESKAYSLSGGERRRLEITRALVQRPKFMLLDEPFAGIDPIAVNDIQQIVKSLRHRGIGVIISDHNVEQTLEIVDRAYIMFEGRIRVGGTVSELVWNDDVAEIYLGPTLTQRMRQRYPKPEAAVV